MVKSALRSLVAQGIRCSSTACCECLHPFLDFRRLQEHIVSRALSKFQYIPTPELHIPPAFNPIPIENSPIGRVEIDDIWLHPSLPVPKLPSLRCVSELDHCVLLTAAGVFNWHVHNRSLASQQPAAARVQLQIFHLLIAFEDVHSPPRGGGRKARFGRLIVFENSGCASDSISLACQRTRGRKARFLLLCSWRLVCFHHRGLATKRCLLRGKRLLRAQVRRRRV